MYFYLAFVSQRDTGSRQMMSRKSCIKFRVRIVSTQSEINGHSTLRSSRKSFIIRFISKIDIRRIKRYGQHPHLKSDTQLAFPDFHLIGILSPKTLITEQADPLIEKANTHTMLFIEQSKRHISPKVHHARSMCKTHQLHAIRTINIHFIICLPHPAGMIISLHLPVLTEACIKLRLTFCRTKEKTDKNYIFQDTATFHQYKN